MKILNYLIIIPVKAYQFFLSPVLGKNCRFNPTCSNYMLEAVKEWGLIKGLFLGIKRISKCHPWGKSGDDPVPNKPKKY